MAKLRKLKWDTRKRICDTLSWENPFKDEKKQTHSRHSHTPSEILGAAIFVTLFHQGHFGFVVAVFCISISAIRSTRSSV